MSCNYQSDLRCHIFVIALALVAAVGCGGVAQSPVAPSPTAPVMPSPPPAAPPTGPHFALELQAQSMTTYDGEPWWGVVSVAVNPNIIRPELPVRVTTTCGSTAQVHPLGSGSARFSCLLPVGTHQIGALAEMADGRRFGNATTATVIYRPSQVLPLYYDVIVSMRDSTDVAFGFQTFQDATYYWDFGDGDTQTTLLGGTSHRYSGPSTERKASVKVTKEGRTIATGSVVGIW